MGVGHADKVDHHAEMGDIGGDVIDWEEGVEQKVPASIIVGCDTKRDWCHGECHLEE